MDLSDYIYRINALSPLNQGVSYNSSHWLKFGFAKKDISVEIAHITTEFNESFSRQDIIDFLRRDDSSLLRGFLMTMIWGHGFTNGNRADNRGPWKVAQMFADFDQSMTRLNNAKEALMRNDIKAAHSTLDGMPRCRVNFFSKFLYFLGRSLDMECYPLIFDARVATTLAKLNALDTDIFSMIDTSPKQDSSSYASYVKLVHNEAKRLGIDADKIEYFLYLGVDNSELNHHWIIK